ncbi:MAG: TlpA disulfide reductase family protein, partial [Bacteroidia bacterium]
MSLSFIFFLGIANAQPLKKWQLKDLAAAIGQADHPTIFNFWATFCKPCIQEIPYFQDLVQEYKSRGVELILVSLDLPESFPDKINSFVSAHGYKQPVYFLNETNADLFCPAVDKSWSGAIPASLFINQKTGYRKF